MTDNIIHLSPIEGRDDDIFGVGINCVTGEPASHSCVSGFVRDPNPEHQNHDKFESLVVSNSESYSSAVSTTVKASVDGACWSASASVSTLHEETGSDTCISFVGMRAIETDRVVVSMKGASIDPQALALLEAEGPLAFADRYGTHCAFGVGYGGTFVGRLKIETHSQSEKDVVAESLSASMESFGVSGKVDASFESSFSSATSNCSTSVHSDSTGAGKMDYGKSDLEGMMDACRSFKLDFDPERGVHGEAIAYSCRTWDQFTEIHDLLEAKGWTGQLRFEAEMAVLSILSKEYSALMYIEGTCESVLLSKSYALPAYGGVLQKAAALAAKARAGIRSLKLVDVFKLDEQSVQAFIVSPTLAPIVDAIASNGLAMWASYQMDETFHGERSGAGICWTPGIAEADGYVKELVRGAADPPQQMWLKVSAWQPVLGTVEFRPYMQFYDPALGSDPVQNQTWSYGPSIVADQPGTAGGSSTVQWNQFPEGNWMTVELADPDSLIGDSQAAGEVTAAAAPEMEAV